MNLVNVLQRKTWVVKPTRIAHSRAMATTTELLENVLSLPDSDRSYLASKLLESLDDGGVSTEWDEEIARRVSTIDDGSARLIPHDEVMASARRAIGG
jgi:putative addiction module component (TIGR02574 family)